MSIRLCFLLLSIPTFGHETMLECSCADTLNRELFKIRKQLDEANIVIKNLIDSNRQLRTELQSSRNIKDDSEKPMPNQKLAPESSSFNNNVNRKGDDFSYDDIKINGWDDNVDDSNEFVYGLPQSDPQTRRKIVIELGANNGEWIRGFLASNPDYWPLIVEPQPMYRDILREIAMEVIS